MKRVITIQDFSCLGRCSLTAALPVISAAGVEGCGLPTAVLTNHPGLPGSNIKDLTEEIKPIGEQLKRLGVRFDAIYTGYIANAGQMEIIKEFIAEFRGQDTIVFVDPVMGDNGRMYSALTEDYPEKMRELCAVADVITPNITEACLMLGLDYDKYDTMEMLFELKKLGAGTAVITGVESKTEGTVLTGAAAYDGERFYEEYALKQPVLCSGTGDLFTAALAGAIMRGTGFERALKAAVSFCAESARLTAADPDRREYGVNFEQALSGYMEEISKP